jgi:hypothetical protein
MTNAAASNFQLCNGSFKNNADAPIPNIGTSNAIGATVAAGCRARSHPQIP